MLPEGGQDKAVTATDRLIVGCDRKMRNTSVSGWYPYTDVFIFYVDT